MSQSCWQRGDIDVDPLLRDITVPTLVTHGSGDRCVDFATAPYLAERIPNAKLYAFHGGGHMAMLTSTKEFCDVVRRFVQEE